MPKIQLKPNSAEYADPDTRAPARKKGCDMPGCRKEAEFKAPKDRSLSEHYRFCLDHVQEYNKAWNYFSGMAQADIEDYMIRSTLGDRPTWRYDAYARLEETLKDRVWQTYRFTDAPPKQEKRFEAPFERQGPEFEAMALMGLEPPLSLKEIKARYKILAKQHHPDLNPGNAESAELLKRINMAYTILRLAYEKFEKLE